MGIEIPEEPPPASPKPPIADLSHRSPDRRPDWSIIDESLAGRISQTVACTDADAIPRVGNAGDTIVRDGERLQVMHNGVLVTEGGYYGVLSSEIIRCLRGVHEPQEEVAFDAVIRRLAATRVPDRPPTMIELGSFWAYYSLWFLDSFPDGHTICLEPDPRNLVVGQRNFEINGRTGTFINAAIGAGSGATMSFTPDDRSAPIELPTHDLRSLLAMLDEPRVDILLADIQGGETALFADSIDVLRTGIVRFVVVSTHDLSISGSAMTHQGVLRNLLDAGGHIICEHSVTESASGDGLVVASFDPADRDLTVAISYSRARHSLSGEWEPRIEEYRRREKEARAALAIVTAERDEARARLQRMRTSPLRSAYRALLAPFRRRRDGGGR